MKLFWCCRILNGEFLSKKWDSLVIALKGFQCLRTLKSDTNHGELCVVLVFFPKVTLAAHGVLEVSSDDITVNEVMAALQETALSVRQPGCAVMVRSKRLFFVCCFFCVFRDTHLFT